MGIDFSQDRWDIVRTAAAGWWSGELHRPMISVTLTGREPGRDPPALQGDLLETVYDLSVPAEQIVDAWDYQLCTCEFLGDAFPTVWPYFGPVQNIAWFGAGPEVRPAEGTVWYHLKSTRNVADLHFAHDPANKWLARTEDIYRAAADRWGDTVGVGMPGLATGLDVLTTFRPSEKLLLDLSDTPEEVLRCVDEIREAFWQQWRMFDEILAPGPGYTGWIPLLSPEPMIALQCDLCYMISPEMFGRFVLPDLAAICRGIGRSIYHLDGVGQLPHLHQLLSIEALSAVQWVPGAGQPGLGHWPDVHHRIREAGKNIQLYGGMDTLDTVADQLGSPKGLWLLTGGHVSQADEFRKALERYGAA